MTSGPRFTVGEEVLFRGERYVVAGMRPEPYRFRLLATRPEGARIVWAAESELAPMRSYTDPRDDTGRS